ncbi:uncharacterized protein LOC120636824 [Pararge aegeria]|uniref:uncharacterized protein LOC120635948 n=1 Tax=Pararge aegeria TaxID=116150 RepID=UPI0019CFA59B|nr:uncharacterized protein LOC120635948 [Pararge aegeria]XP_039764322.1 uncharacterized protein LOC120636824 [Pararge aegeria]
MTKAGKEPEVPDFKKFMDLDFKNKKLEEWRNNLPDDLAARLTKEKLYNLFQDVSYDILSELLMALDNNFQETVELWESNPRTWTQKEGTPVAPVGRRTVASST